MNSDVLRSIAFRPANAEDEQFLKELYASTRLAEIQAWGLDERQKEMFLDLQYRAQSQHYRLAYPRAEHLIILADSLPVGRLLIDRRDNEIVLVDIALLSRARSRGLGSFLIRQLLDESISVAKPVILHVLKSNPALRLYQRLGFSILRDDGVYFEMKWAPQRI